MLNLSDQLKKRFLTTELTYQVSNPLPIMVSPTLGNLSEHATKSRKQPPMNMTPEASIFICF